MAQPSVGRTGVLGLANLDDRRPKPRTRVRGALGLDDDSEWEAPLLAAPEEPEMPTGPAAFTGVSREDVYRGAKERRGPGAWQIRQRGASLCGPAAFMYITATHHPARYYEFATKLFEKGDARLGDLRITPGDDCRAYKPGARLDAVDWVTLAGIRDSENAVFDLDDIDDAFAGITLPGELASWFRKAGYTNVLNETNLYLTKGRGNFLDALGQHSRGRRVCFFIDANGIQSASPGRGRLRRIFTSANHWVVLRNVISAREDDVRFEVFTWGEPEGGVWRVPQAPPGSRMSMKVWLQNYYGFVSCEV